MNSSCEEIVICKSCAVCIYNREFGLFVVCAGPCKSSHHISCVGISMEQRRAISGGIVWLCEECLPALNDCRKDERSSPISPAANATRSDIIELRSQVSMLMETLHRIIPDDASAAIPSMLHSTPVVTTDIYETNDSCNNDTGTDRIEQTPNSNGPAPYETTTTDERCFALLLSNIDSSASESDVKAMVCKCLNVPVDDRVSLVKLVSKRIDCRLLDYVSFKVLLKWKYKDLALNTASWPTGIRFREFHHRSIQTWKP